MDVPFEPSLTLIVSSGLLGALVGVAYVLVLFDNAGLFPLDLPPSNYLDSPYWLGLPSDTVLSIAVLQACAAVGAVVWFIWLCTTSDQNFGDSILNSEVNRVLIVQVFLWSSILWPFAAYFFVLEKTTARAILVCLPLWAAAAAVLLMIGGTFESGAPPWATLGVLFLGLVVVLCDGAGWTAVAIKSTLQ